MKILQGRGMFEVSADLSLQQLETHATSNGFSKCTPASLNLMTFSPCPVAKATAGLCKTVQSGHMFTIIPRALQLSHESAIHKLPDNRLLSSTTGEETYGLE